MDQFAEVGAVDGAMISPVWLTVPLSAVNPAVELAHWMPCSGRVVHCNSPTVIRWFSGMRAGVKGPPEEPYIWVEPDPFLDMESRARGIRPVPDWQSQAGTVVYRREFQAP